MTKRATRKRVPQGPAGVIMQVAEKPEGKRWEGTQAANSERG